MKGLKIAIATAALVLGQQMSAQAGYFKMSDRDLSIYACASEDTWNIRVNVTNRIYGKLDKGECMEVSGIFYRGKEIYVNSIKSSRQDLYLRATDTEINQIKQLFDKRNSIMRAVRTRESEGDYQY